MQKLFSEDLLTFMFVSDGSGAKREAQNYSLFTQQEWKLADVFTLVTGARYDYHSQFKGHPTFRLSGMYKVNKKYDSSRWIFRRFRAPTLKELYTDWFHPYGGGFQIIGNNNMKAEKSNNFNISSDLNFKN
ncbi:TonB-dependent receptor domain-containing protein [Chryseobacterium indoltheticum]|uniref:TonB-dependent receptor domain-containing protein n=1 Tax=Chryseobacterium indoltheticum TaxID=254 RepID=UPI003F49AA6F